MFPLKNSRHTGHLLSCVEIEEELAELGEQEEVIL
jgi:hypothetical protein